MQAYIKHPLVLLFRLPPLPWSLVPRSSPSTPLSPPPPPAELRLRSRVVSAVAAACRRRPWVRQGVEKPGRRFPFAAGHRRAAAAGEPSRRRHPLVAGRHPSSFVAFVSTVAFVSSSSTRRCPPIPQPAALSPARSPSW